MHQLEDLTTRVVQHTIPAFTSPGQIADSRLPDIEAKTPQIEDSIDAEEALTAHLVQKDDFQSQETQRAAVEDCQARYDRVSALCSEAEEDFRRKEERKGNWFRAMFFLACFAASFFCEWVFTAQTLPFLLNVSDGLTGWAIALAPTASLTVLEAILMFLVFQPLQKIADPSEKSNKTSVPQVLVTVWFVLVLSACAVGNFVMIEKLVAAREEAAKIKYEVTRGTRPRPRAGDSRPEAVAVNQRMVNDAVLWVSFIVSLNAPLLLALGLDEWRRCRDRRKALRKLTSLRAESEVLHKALREQLAALRVREHAYAQSAQYGELVGEKWRKDRLVERQGASQDPARCRSFVEITKLRLLRLATASDHE